jgi:hypothetical protein
MRPSRLRDRAEPTVSSSQGGARLVERLPLQPWHDAPRDSWGMVLFGGVFGFAFVGFLGGAFCFFVALAFRGFDLSLGCRPGRFADPRWWFIYERRGFVFRDRRRIWFRREGGVHERGEADLPTIRSAVLVLGDQFGAVGRFAVEATDGDRDFVDRFAATKDRRGGLRRCPFLALASAPCPRGKTVGDIDRRQWASGLNIALDDRRFAAGDIHAAGRHRRDCSLRTRRQPTRYAHQSNGENQDTRSEQATARIRAHIHGRDATGRAVLDGLGLPGKDQPINSRGGDTAGRGRRAAPSPHPRQRVERREPPR